MKSDAIQRLDGHIDAPSQPVLAKEVRFWLGKRNPLNKNASQNS